MVIFIAMTAGLYVFANLVFKRVSIATVGTVLASVAVNLVHESWGRWSQIGLDDVVFWGPLLILFSGIAAGAIALVLVPFALAIKVTLELARITRSEPPASDWDAVGRALLRVL